METNAIISELSTVLKKINEEKSAANKGRNSSVSPGLRFAAAIIESRILDLKIEESSSRDSDSESIELLTPENIIAFRNSESVIDIYITEEHHFTICSFDEIENALIDNCKHYRETGSMPVSAFSDCSPEEPSTDYYVGVKKNLDALAVKFEGDKYANKLAYLYDMYKKGEVETIFRVQVEDNLI